MSVYYNDADPFVCQWLRNLIAAQHLPAGEVDERAIQEVQPDDVRGFRQAHFFAGIGGWPYALHLAGWGDRPIWTGSPPCQPFSYAGKRQASNDARHLWPEWHRLVSECRPQRIFGEQVTGALGLGWWDRVAADLEAEAYTVGAVVLGSHSVEAPHKRLRLYWCAIADTNAERRGREGLKPQEAPSEMRPQPSELARLLSGVLESAVPAGRNGALADGIPARTPKLRAYGNAIDARTGALFVRAYLETMP